MVSPGRKWVLNHGKIWKKMSKKISVKNLELYQKKNSKTCAYVHAVDYILWTWCFAKTDRKTNGGYIK